MSKNEKKNKSDKKVTLFFTVGIKGSKWRRRSREGLEGGGV